MQKKKLLIGAGIVFVLICVAVGLVFQKKPTPAQKISDEGTQTKLYLNPASGQFDLNSTVDTTIMLDSGNNKISTFTTTLHYDTDKLTYVSYEKISSGFDTYTVNANNNGEIILTTEADPTQVLPSGNSQAIIKVHFLSKSSSGNAVFSFSDTTIAGDPYTVLLSHTETTSTYQIGLPTLTGSPSPSPTITSGQTSPTPTTTAANNCDEKSNGDANCDGQINKADFTIWEASFKNNGSDKTADFNKDGKINLNDFVLWRQSICKVGSNGYVCATL